MIIFLLKKSYHSWHFMCYFTDNNCVAIDNFPLTMFEMENNGILLLLLYIPILTPLTLQIEKFHVTQTFACQLQPIP